MRCQECEFSPAPSVPTLAVPTCARWLTMRRSLLLGAWVLLVSVLMHPRAAFGGRVVIVQSSDAEPYRQAEAALRSRLSTDHHDVRTVMFRSVTEQNSAETMGSPDLVIAIGMPAAKSLQTQIPVNARLVYCMVSKPEEAGLFQGRAAWAVTTDIPVADQVRLLAEALPKARDIGTLYRSDVPEARAAVRALRDAVPAHWSVVAIAVNEYPSIAAAIGALVQSNVDVIWTSRDQGAYDTATVRALLLAALRHKVPVWGFSPAFVQAGALVGVGIDPRAQGTQAGDLAATLLADRKPASDKPQPPRDPQIAVNFVVGRQLGVEIPESFLKRAAIVFRPE